MSKPKSALHVRPQDAESLLDPVRIELNRLTTRLDHYLAKLKLDDADIVAITRAREVVKAAADTVADIEASARES